MDRNTTIGFVLIALVLVVWMWLNAPQPGVHQQQAVDTAQTQKARAQTTKAYAPTPTMADKVDSLGRFFTPLSRGTESSVEGQRSVHCDHFLPGSKHPQVGTEEKLRTWDQHTVNLINSDDRGEFNLLFYSADGKLINTSGLYFSPVKAMPASVPLKGAIRCALTCR